MIVYKPSYTQTDKTYVLLLSGVKTRKGFVLIVLATRCWYEGSTLLLSKNNNPVETNEVTGDDTMTDMLWVGSVYIRGIVREVFAAAFPIACITSTICSPLLLTEAMFWQDDNAEVTVALFNELDDAITLLITMLKISKPIPAAKTEIWEGIDIIDCSVLTIRSLLVAISVACY
jgi:hypothetical protein